MKKVLKRLARVTALLVLALVVVVAAGVVWPDPAPPAPPAVTPLLALTNVSVVDVERGELVDGATTVLVRDGRIVTIAGVDSVDVPAEARRIDGTGRFLIPALWDMHVHLLRKSPELHYPLLVAHGVTNIREMGFLSPSGCRSGSDPLFTCPADLEAWNRSVDSGRMAGPRVAAYAAFQIEGPADFGLDRETMAGPQAADQVRGTIRALRERGVDFIKLTMEDDLTLDLYSVLLEEARRVGLPVIGHLPRPMSALQAAEGGMRSVEHARVFLTDCFPRSSNFRAREISGSMELVAEMVEQHDPAMCDKVFQAFVEHDTWFTPTHITRRWEAMYHDPIYRADKRLRQVPLVHRLVWNVDAFFIDLSASESAGREALIRFYDAGLEITGQAHHRGVKILAGTDALDAHAFYGSGLHDELNELVKAGLTPGEALQTATLNPARFLGLEASQGSVNAGKWAELVLLDANPLENIHNVRRIEAVVARDRVYDRRHLDELVTSVETLAGRWQTSCKLLWELIRSMFTG
jgi:hypothetical protein